MYMFGVPGAIFVATSWSDLYVSRDDGASFTKPTLDPENGAAFGVGAIWSPDGQLVAGTGCAIFIGCKFTRSNDGGRTWQPSVMIPGQYTQSSGVGGYSPPWISGGAGASISMVAQGGDASGGVSRSWSIAEYSSDGGQTFQMSNPLQIFALWRLWGAPTGEIWAVGYDDGAMPGNVAFFQNGTLTASPTPTMGSLDATWGSSADDVHAVGDGGVILHYHR